MPAAGNRWNDNLNNAGNNGNYWSSTQNPDNNNAYNLNFNSGNANWNNNNRNNGQSVRPVSSTYLLSANDCGGASFFSYAEAYITFFVDDHLKCHTI